MFTSPGKMAFTYVGPRPPADPLYNQVTLLLNMESPGGQVGVFRDQKGGGTIINTGSVIASNARAKFGATSAFINSISQLLQVPYSSGFAFGSGDFTVELWVNLTSYHGGNTQLIANKRDGVISEVAWQSAVNSSGFVTTILTSGSSDTIISGAGTVAVPLNSWTHFAVSRNGTAVRQFVNGQAAGSTTVAAGLTLNPGTQPLWLGGALGGDFHAEGYFGNTRITKGTGRYTAPFTPPAVPFPDY